MKYVLTALLCLAIVATTSAAPTDDEQAYIDEAQAKLNATFQNLTVTDFKPSPVDGLFEINIGGRVVYFHPDAEVLIFGEIFSKDGRSLTAESQALTTARLIDDLPLEQAVIVGPEDGVPIVEFTDPDCPYCREYHNYVSGVGQSVKRIIFFETRIHPSARPKAIHVLCATDQEAAFMDVYSRDIPPNELNTCDDGEALADAHLTISKSAGVDATPTLFLGRTSVRGFRRDAIAQYIAEQARLLARN